MGIFSAPRTPSQHRQTARVFCLRRRARRARPRRFPADVEQISARPLHFQRVFYRALRIKELAAIGKTVRRYIQDTHHQGSLAELEHTRAQMQPVLSALKHPP
jgi:hypothetical protein